MEWDREAGEVLYRTGRGHAEERGSEDGIRDDVREAWTARRARVGKIEHDLIARGVFTSLGDLSPKVMRYIRAHNDSPKPITWSNTDTSNRIRTDIDSAATGP